jgi:hypothetical protein
MGNLSNELLLLVVGGQSTPKICKPNDPIPQPTVVTPWNGRYCDGPVTRLNKDLEYAHKLPDVMNSLIQGDFQAVIDANQRQPGIVCGPGDLQNTP